MAVEAGRMPSSGDNAGSVILGLYGPLITKRKYVGEVVDGKLNLQIGLDPVVAATLWVLLTAAIVGEDRLQAMEVPSEVVEMLGGGEITVRTFPVTVVNGTATADGDGVDEVAKNIDCGIEIAKAAGLVAGDGDDSGEPN